MKNLLEKLFNLRHEQSLCILKERANIQKKIMILLAEIDALAKTKIKTRPVKSNKMKSFPYANRDEMRFGNALRERSKQVILLF
jgi:hypothetical protein